jgi:hypothetical protein
MTVYQNLRLAKMLILFAVLRWLSLEKDRNYCESLHLYQ